MPYRKKEVSVRPQRRAADAIDDLEQMVVVVPVDGDEGEAEGIDRELRAERPEIRQGVSVGRAEVEHPDRDHDREHAVAEGFEAAAAHAR